MIYGSVSGLQQPLSRIVLGGPFGERSDAESFSIMDRFVQLGGNVVETAHAYAAGAAEEQVGRWLRRHDGRQHIAVITKVCHPHGNDPASLASFEAELDLSLQRLGVSCIDLVLLHRDPVGDSTHEVLEKLEHARARGLIRAYGISNVTAERLAQFDRSAAARGVEHLPIISNYFGLARQACAPWAGVVQLDEAGERWLQRRGAALLCWSALAQGWFAHRELPQDFRAVYEAPINHGRRRRADEIAATRGVSGMQVALAYALAMPFKSFASVGPRSVTELEQIAAAADLKLGAADCEYLRGTGHERE